MEPHLANLANNLQLVADLGYGDVALCAPERDGSLVTIADARPVTAVSAIATSRVGQRLDVEAEPEAYEAFASARPVVGERMRVTRGITFFTRAYPVGPVAGPYAVLVRHLSEQVVESPGKMEVAFMEAAESLIEVLGEGPLRDNLTEEPFVTARRPGDGLVRIASSGTVVYASPNAINILRAASLDGLVQGMSVTELPGSATAISPVLLSGGCRRTEMEAANRVLDYRAMAVPGGAVLLVEDVTEANRREQELKIKETTIREVHHRVKNNLQTIASLLRIQARRSDDDALVRALGEAIERISSMAVVHDMLAGSTDERIDFAEVARSVVDMVRRSVLGPDSKASVSTSGSSGEVPANVATPLALVIAELVHNALEHGISGGEDDSVEVTLRRLPEELHLVVRDNGRGLPEDFDVDATSTLGLAIVRTLVQDDLGGTLAFGAAPRGTTVTIRVPLEEEGG